MDLPWNSVLTRPGEPGVLWSPCEGSASRSAPRGQPWLLMAGTFSGPLGATSRGLHWDHFRWESSSQKLNVTERCMTARPRDGPEAGPQEDRDGRAVQATGPATHLCTHAPGVSFYVSQVPLLIRPPIRSDQGPL